MGIVQMSFIYEANIIKKLLGIDIEPEKVFIRCQEYEKDKGITDLELTDEEQFYIIIETEKKIEGAL